MSDTTRFTRRFVQFDGYAGCKKGDAFHTPDEDGYHITVGETHEAMNSPFSVRVLILPVLATKMQPGS